MPEKIQDTLIIPVGTQIVVVDNDSKFNGRTGAVIDYPFGELESDEYYVRLPDRGEHRFFRKQIKYRKNVQKEGLIQPTPPEVMRQNIIYKCIVGSTAYGMAIEGSDKDYRGIYLAPAEYQWSLWGPSEHFEFSDPDEQYYELKRFIELALKANPNILEILSSPLVLETSPLAEKLIENRNKFLSKTVFNTYNGYAMSQFGKLEQDIRSHVRLHLESKAGFSEEAIKEETIKYFVSMPVSEALHRLDINISNAIRWKHAAHLIRLLISGIHIMNHGEVLVDVGPWRKDLVAIRNKEMPWDEVDKWRLELHTEFDAAYNNTLLPEKADFHFWNQFLIEARAERARDWYADQGQLIAAGPAALDFHSRTVLD